MAVESVLNADSTFTDNLPIGIFSVAVNDPLTILYANNTFFQKCGYTRDQLKNEHNDSFAELMENGSYDYVISSLKVAEASEIKELELEFQIIRRDGKVLWILGSFVLQNKAAKPSFLCSCVDITQRRNMEEELRVSEERYKLALEQSLSAIFDYDVATKTAYCSDAAINSYGLPQKIDNVPESLVDSRFINKKSAADFIRAFSQLRAGKKKVSCDVLCKINNEYLWHKFTVAAILDHNGETSKAVCTLQDISETKKRELAYSEAKHQRASMMSDAIAFYEVNFTKNTVENYHGIWQTEFRALGKNNFSEIAKLVEKKAVFQEDRPLYAETMSRDNIEFCFNRGITDISFEYRRFNTDGKMFWVSTTFQLVKDPKTGDIKGFAYLKNIDKVKRAEMEKKFHDEHDVITGLYNSKTVEKLVFDYFQSERNHKQYCAFFKIHIENLNKLYDTYGPEVTGQILTDIAMRINTAFRSDDIIGRFDNESFIAVAKNLLFHDSAAEIAKRLCDLLKKTFQDQNSVCCNIGVSVFPSDGTTYNELFNKAQTAVMQAEKLGSNRYACYIDAMGSEDFNIYEAEEQDEAPAAETKPSAPVKAKAVRKKETALPFILFSVMLAVILLITILSVSPIGMLNTVFSRTYQKIIWLVVIIAINVAGASLFFKYSRKKLNQDPITGHNNREVFEETVAKFVKTNTRIKYAMIFINVDKFKIINDRYGKETGDMILKALHRNIDADLYPYEVSGRLSSDNFAVLMEFDGKYQLEKRLNKISVVMERMSDGSNNPYGIHISYGIFPIYDVTMDVNTMLDRANIALSLVSKTNRISYGIYDDKIKRKMDREHDLENKMREALNHRDFKVYLQPKFDIYTDTIIGAEALVRWIDSDGSIIMPGEFIPLFERNGFIVQLDIYMFEEVCKTIRKWIYNGLAPVCVSVNMSKANFEIPNFLNVYENILTRSGIPPQFIEFEFTETIANDSIDEFMFIIEQIHAIGCKCSMDDFGSGYSSLNMLQNIRVDVLKLDRAFFVNENEDEQRRWNVIKNVIALARSLDIKTVSEGIEDPHQVELLREANCDYVQGNVYSEPLPVHEFEKLEYGSMII